MRAFIGRFFSRNLYCHVPLTGVSKCHMRGKCPTFSLKKTGGAISSFAMEKVYKCRVDLWMKAVIFISCAFLICLAVSLCREGRVWDSVAVVSGAALVALFLYPAKIVLRDECFMVRSGIIRLRYYYRDIRDVRLSNNPFSLSLLSALQFAFSLRAVHVTFKKGFFGLLISPERRDEFVGELLKKRDEFAGA